MTLTDKVKQLIVVRLACYDRPVDIIRDLKADLGIDVPPGQISRYNPRNAEGASLARDLVELFEVTRERYNAAIGDVAISSKRWRLEQLQGLIEGKRPQGIAPALMLSALEQAAKEVEGAFAPRPAPGAVTASVTDGDKALTIRVVYEDMLGGDEAEER